MTCDFGLVTWVCFLVLVFSMMIEVSCLWNCEFLCNFKVSLNYFLLFFEEVSYFFTCLRCLFFLKTFGVLCSFYWEYITLMLETWGIKKGALLDSIVDRCSWWSFSFPRLCCKKGGAINKDLSHRIRIGWLKPRSATGVLHHCLPFINYHEQLGCDCLTWTKKKIWLRQSWNEDKKMNVKLR